MNEELKACPFCGGEAKIIDCPQSNEVFVMCRNCGIMTGAKLSRKQVIMDWNRRTVPENKALTVFEKITQSPEALAKFLRAIDIGKIQLDSCFCKSDCEDDNCPHELQCIINWLCKSGGSRT